ncbi:MAG: hypothetical protein NVSMB6_29380 [Burkholderiaceae bacterium]
MITLSSVAISAGMIPLLLAFALDVFVVVLVVLDDALSASFGAIATMLVLTTLWFIVPIVGKRQHA